MALICVLGWWRAEEMIFAGQFSNAQWGAFLTANETLTKACVLALTIALPVFAGVSFDWGYQSLRYAIQWQKARALHRGLSRRLETVHKQHEAEVEKLEHQLLIVDHENDESTQGYLEHHQLGQKVGAQRPVLELMVLKIAAVAVLLVGGCYLINPLVAPYLPSGRFILYVCITLGLTGLYAYRSLKGRDRPTATQLYQHRGIIWRDQPAQEQHNPPPPETDSPPPRSEERDISSVVSVSDTVLGREVKAS